MLPLLLVLALTQVKAFNVSNTLGNGMVLQREPASAVVWGSATPGIAVATTFAGETFSAVTDVNGTWRQALPPQPASKGGQ